MFSIFPLFLRGTIRFPAHSFWLVLPRLDELLEQGAVAFLLHFFHRDESQRRGIDAVTQVRRTGTVVKHVAEMRIGGLRTHLSSFHAQCAVAFLDDFSLLHRPGETGPARAGIEFVERTEQRLAGNDVDVNAGFVIVPVSVLERRFSAALLRDLILEWIELLLKFS